MDTITPTMEKSQLHMDTTTLKIFRIQLHMDTTKLKITFENDAIKMTFIKMLP